MSLNAPTIMLIISGLAVVSFVILLGTSTWYLVGHARREKIHYKNFLYKVQFFNVQVNPMLQGFFFLVFIALGVLLLYTGLTYQAEYRVYAFSFFLALILSSMLYGSYFILSQLNENMTEYKHNYQKAREAIMKKEEAAKSIEDTKNYKQNILQMIKRFEVQIKQVDDPSRFHLKDSVKLIDQFTETQTRVINQFEEEVLSRFDKALERYFEHKIPVPLELPKQTLTFEEDYKKVQNSVFTNYHKLFNETLYTLVDEDKYNTSKIITDGLQILKDNNFSPAQELVELILIRMDNIEGSPEGLIDYLLEKKIVELEELISYAINKKIFWVFKNDLFETQDQLSTISERLIKDDAYNLSITFISNYFTRLRTVLAFMDKLKEQNRTMNLFKNYKKVMNVDATFFDESRVYENKLMSIKEFFEGRRKSDELKRKLVDISKPHQAYENKEDINDVYQTVLTQFEDLRLNATQSLLLYSGEHPKYNYFDLVKTSQQVNNLTNRLLMKDVLVATLLLYALFIYSNDDEELYNEVLQSMEDCKELHKYLSHINYKVPFTEHKDLARRIIQDILIDEEQGRTANFIANVEQERKTLHKIMQIS